MKARSFGGLVAAILTVTVAAGCQSNGGGPKTPPITPSQPATRPATTAPSTTAAPQTSSTSAGGDTFTMPNEVGKVLQDAQDDVQRVSGNPVFITHSVDATGQDRFQVLDRNWKVCSQNVAAGKRVSQDADITFSVVKLDESCP